MKKHRIFQWKSILKRVKMCEIVNCEINMMYITWNNVASVWECQKWRLKTNLFWETSKISMFFSPVSHCGTLYSKSLIQCTRPNTALWAPAARQLWSDGFRRLMNRFGRASSMLWLWWFTDRLPIFAWNFAFPADFWCRGYPLQNISCVTQLAQPSWDDSCMRTNTKLLTSA